MQKCYTTRMHIRVKAFPDAKKEHIEMVSDQQLRIFVREPAQDNRANKRIRELVAQHYSVPENTVRMISGHQHMNKIFELNEKTAT